VAKSDLHKFMFQKRKIELGLAILDNHILPSENIELASSSEFVKKDSILSSLVSMPGVSVQEFKWWEGTSPQIMSTTDLSPIKILMCSSETEVRFLEKCKKIFAIQTSHTICTLSLFEQCIDKLDGNMIQISFPGFNESVSSNKTFQQSNQFVFNLPFVESYILLYFLRKDKWNHNILLTSEYEEKYKFIHQIQNRELHDTVATEHWNRANSPQASQLDVVKVVYAPLWVKKEKKKNTDQLICLVESDVSNYLPELKEELILLFK